MCRKALGEGPDFSHVKVFDLQRGQGSDRYKLEIVTCNEGFILPGVGGGGGFESTLRRPHTKSLAEFICSEVSDMIK